MNLLNQRQLAAAAVPAVPPQSIATSQLLALMVVFVLSVLLVGIVYWVVVDKFSRWMHQRRRRATSVYLLQFGLVIANAALFNQIEMGELMAGRGSQADFWLAIGLAVLLPPFALVSVLLPIGTAGEVQRVHRLTRENRDLDLWAQHARRARDEVVRLVGCITGTAKERTARLHESETRDGQNCTTLQSALDGETHLKRLVEAIHLLFEPRASAGPTEQ